jgi:nucleotide-binding universal stress UspA family protein
MADVVLGYDGSECAATALRTAIELAAALGDRIVVAYAAEPPNRLLGEELAEHRRALDEIGVEVTAEAVSRAREAGVEAEAAIVHERPAAALLDLARTRNARLIVVGTTSERPLTGAILGSVPHKLLHRSEIPVVVVPATVPP